jgi:hypothetical protein
VCTSCFDCGRRFINGSAIQIRVHLANPHIFSINNFADEVVAPQDMFFVFALTPAPPRYQFTTRQTPVVTSFGQHYDLQQAT